MLSIKKSAGQAVIEYIIVFAFMSLLGFALVRGIAGAFSNTVGSLGYALTNELSTGVCPSQCFNSSFNNRLQ